jgi:cobalt-precorrin 5A hydrolase
VAEDSGITRRKPLAVYAVTRPGLEIARRLKAALPAADVFVTTKLRESAPPDAIALAAPLGPAVAETFARYECHVFVLSVGATVRLIAPLAEDKRTDPAVVCVDDAARWAVCVLSGHVGRGNQFATEIAAALGAEPVVTTASDALGTLGVDILGRDLGWKLDDPQRNLTRGAAAVVNGTAVMFVQETGEPDWWPLDEPLPPGVSYATSLGAVDPQGYEILLIASDRLLDRTDPAHFANAVVYRPKSLVLGLGCDKHAPAEMVERGVQSLLQEHGLAVASVRELATIDVKRDEPAFVALSRKYGWPLRTFTAAELSTVAGVENPSSTVQRHVGTPAVAEAAALHAAGAERLALAKQTYTEPGADRSMTLAVARIPFAPRPEIPQPKPATPLAVPRGKGLVVIYTGDGKGKTTAALGLMARCLGRGYPVGVVQFIKGKWKTGEQQFAALFPQVAFHVMGRGFTWESEDLTRDRQAAREAWQQGQAMIASGRYFAVILDEITYAINFGFIELAEVLDALRHRPASVHVILTGRNAPAELIAAADLVTEMRNIKHPFDQGMKAQLGIDF